MAVVDYGIKLASLLNKEKIQWAFGGSCLLYFLNLPVSPRDLDVVVALKDVERARAVLEAHGAVLLEEKLSDNHYLTKKFYTLSWESVEVDFMASPGISNAGETYYMPFDETGPWRDLDLSGEQIFLSDPRHWLKYYGLMNGRENRVAMLQAYLGSE